MQCSIRAAMLVAVLSIGSLASARPKLEVLSERLQSSDDFRLRVQAALELGKTKDRRALSPLVLALDDAEGSVRAAAAAALGKLRDPRCVPALELHAKDASAEVRAAIQSALALYENKDQPSRAAAPKIRVKVGPVYNGTRVKSPSIERDVLAESNKELYQIQGVDVMSSGAGEDSSPAPQQLKTILLTPSIQKLTASRQGDSIVYFAKIEYVVHTWPEQAILARLSGTASAAATDGEVQDSVAAAALRREVVLAAIHSAMSRVPGALLAASQP